MGQPISLLHVDDQPDFAEVAAEFVEREDDRLTVETATDPSEALDRLATSEFDCIVSDYEMPGMDGIEFLEAVREDYPDLPFILFTGKGSEAVASEAISAGVTDYLQKETGTGQYELLANRVRNAVEKARTEEELHTVRRHFQNLAGQNFVGIYLIQDGEYVYANSRLADIHGYNRAELIGKSVLDLVAPEDRDLARRKLRKRLDEEIEETQYQITGLRKDGERVDLELHGSRVDYQGEPAVIGAALDITDRIEREQTLTALHDAATDLEAADDTEEVYGILTDTAEEILDFALVAVDIVEGDALVQRAWTLEGDAEGYYHQTPLDEDTLATRAYRRRETILADDLREYDITPADPEYRSALTVPIGDVGTFQTVSREVGEFDETDQELAELLVDHAWQALQRLDHEASLRRQRERLRRENNRLDQFAEIVSHDLRNPLRVATGHLDLVRGDCDSDHLDGLETSLDRMETIIDEVLAMARQGQTVEQSELEPVAVDSLLEACWDTVETGGAELQIEGTATIRADANRLKRALENLLRNAVEHGSTGNQPEADDTVEHGSTSSRPKAEDTVEHAGADVTVTVGTLEDGFYVADDGPGMSADERESAFESGYSTADGAGFGLAIVQEIVEAHDWTITATDSETGGARFEIKDAEIE